MSNFKFKAANGENISLGEITHRDNAVIGNGYAKSDMNYFYPSLSFSSDGTQGQAGITTCNNSYNINGQDILNDGYISSEVGTPQEGKGALGKYVFFEDTSNNNAIPSWCNYIRVLLIGGGGGYDINNNIVGGGGAGEFVLQEISVAQISGSSYNITIGNGGTTTSGSGAGGKTTFGPLVGATGDTLIQAHDGSGGPCGAGGGTNLSSPTKVTGQGGWGTEIGGAGAGGYGEYDNHFGFYVGSVGWSIALIREMRGAGQTEKAYGKGGNKNIPGKNGCACVFFFPHQPPAFIQPGYSPPPPPPAPPTQTMTFGPSVIVGSGAGGGDAPMYNPTITSDVNGHLHAIYNKNGGLTYRVSTDLNQTWSVGTYPGEQQDTGFGAAGTHSWTHPHSIKTGPGYGGALKGSIYVAYGSNYQGQAGLWFKRKGPDGLSTDATWHPTNVNCLVNSCGLSLVNSPAIFVSMAVATDLSGTDHIYISYRDNTLFRIMFLRLNYAGSALGGAPTQISTGNSSNASSICVSPTWPQTGTPHIFIAWLQNVEPTGAVMQLKLRKSTDEGITWGSTIIVDSSVGSPGVTSPVTGGAGEGVSVNLYAKDNDNLYISYINNSGGLMLRKSTDGGNTWNSGVAVSGTNNVSYAHSMDISGDNIWISYYSTNIGLGCTHTPDDGQTWFFGNYPISNSNNDPRLNAITVVGDKAYIIGPATNSGTIGQGETNIRCVTVEIT